MSSPKKSSPFTAINGSLSQASGHRNNIRKPARESQLDDLPADVLLEVLIRVPPKAARRMKEVSKGWNSIISSPNYADLSISKYPSSDDHALLMKLITKTNRAMFPSVANPAVLIERRFDLSYISNWCLILSTSEDLILLQTHHNILYVCNPFTKESIMLPPLNADKMMFQIVCEPGQGHRYRVVSYREEGVILCFYNVFVSETGRWNPVVVNPRPEVYIDTFMVPYRGKLYWYSGKDIVAYDPFQDISTSISCPRRKPLFPGDPTRTYFFLGVVRGSLALSSFGCVRVETTKEKKHRYVYDLTIWEYDHELGQWIFKKESRFQELRESEKPGQRESILVALHPIEDVVYLDTDYGVGLHDFSKECDNFSEVEVHTEEMIITSHCIVLPYLLTRPWCPTNLRYGSRRS